MTIHQNISGLVFGFTLFCSILFYGIVNSGSILMGLSREQKVEDTIPNYTIKQEWTPITSLYFEAAGKFFPSINMDFRRKEQFAFCIGAGFWSDSEEHKQILFIPSVNAYYLFGMRKRIELGGGTGPFLGTYSGFASVMLFGKIGYRYQKKKGLFFSAGFTPFIGIPINNKSRFAIAPFAGISLGYSF